jgi:hypothetical protein
MFHSVPGVPRVKMERFAGELTLFYDGFYKPGPAKQDIKICEYHYFYMRCN